jgi:hypothetical protein
MRASVRREAVLAQWQPRKTTGISSPRPTNLSEFDPVARQPVDKGDLFRAVELLAGAAAGPPVRDPPEHRSAAAGRSGRATALRSDFLGFRRQPRLLLTLPVRWRTDECQHMLLLCCVKIRCRSVCLGPNWSEPDFAQTIFQAQI